MTFNTIDAAIITAVFLVPGFVCSAVLSMLVARKSKTTETRAVEFFTFSCINLAVWFWLVVLILSSGFRQAHPFWMSLSLLLVLLVSPVLMGLGFGKMVQKEAVTWLLRRLGFGTIHPIPTAWDYHFSKGLPYWVIITRKDGTRIFGFFGLKSFAGDEPTSRDLYLESVAKASDDGPWVPVEGSGGVWIPGSEIAVIEFKKIKEVDYGDKQGS